jgi:hypothetical protein
MNTLRKNAVVVGILFILATVFGGIAAVIEDPLLGAPDTLPNE